MATATAEIQLLTATVRTLQVGSRQITMSVFNQLDWIDPHDIDPFGRVRTKDWEIDRGIRIVGRDREGILVRSELPHPATTIQGTWCQCVDADTHVDHRYDSHWCYLKESGVTYQFWTRDITPWCRQDYRSESTKPEIVAKHYADHHKGFDKALDDTVAGYWADRHRREKLEALPLIILAGLR